MSTTIFDLTQQSNKSKAPTLGKLNHRDCFMLPNVDSLYMKISPSPSLLNSHMISDVYNRGDCFVINLTTGVFTVLPKWKVIIPVDTTISFQRVGV